MKRLERPTVAGFTLIEMMVVVAIIGVLAGVAVQGYRIFLFRSRTSEVYLNLREIVKGEIVYYSSPQIDSNGNPLPKKFAPFPYTPVDDPCANGSPRYNYDPAIWKKNGWDAIGFSPDRAHFYQYKVETTGTGDNAKMTAIARGNLDCDNTFSTFKIFASVKDGVPKVQGLIAIYENE